MRKLLIALLTTCGALLVAAPEALARAGLGSGGFWGGFRGFGGGFRGGGFGRGLRGPHVFFLGGGGGAVFGVIIALIVIGVLLYVAFGFARNRARSVRTLRRLHARVRRVSASAAEAAQDDAAFDTDTVHKEAEQLFRNVQAAWSDDDAGRLSSLVGDDLMVEWNRRLRDLERRGWRNPVEVLGPVHIDYVGLTNREADAEDRVVVRVTAHLRDYVIDRFGRRYTPNGSGHVMSRVCEYWTLGKNDADHWMLLSIEGEREGVHELSEPLVATPWSDDARMRDESMVELATQDAPEGVKPGELVDVDFSDDARAAANDLSLADPRFAPDVLKASARQALNAWAEAVDGDDHPLRQLATDDAVGSLLYAGDTSRHTRVVVRGLRPRSMTVSALDPDAQPPTMTLALELSGRRYVQDRDTTTVLAGSVDKEADFSQRFTFGLEGPSEHPWRIVSVDAPTGVPGHA